MDSSFGIMSLAILAEDLLNFFDVEVQVTVSGVQGLGQLNRVDAWKIKG